MVAIVDALTLIFSVTGGTDVMVSHLWELHLVRHIELVVNNGWTFTESIATAIESRRHNQVIPMG